MKFQEDMEEESSANASHNSIIKSENLSESFENYEQNTISDQNDFIQLFVNDEEPSDPLNSSNVDSGLNMLSKPLRKSKKKTIKKPRKERASVQFSNSLVEEKLPLLNHSIFSNNLVRMQMKL